MQPRLSKKHLQQVDGWFYNKVGALLGSPELKSVKQIRGFGIKCMLLGVVLLPLVYLSFYIATKSGLVKNSSNPLGYPVAALGMLSPYVFFVGLDCFISGRIWKKSEKPFILSMLNSLGVLFMIIAGAVSIGYLSYYQMVYAPWKARKIATEKAFDKITKDFELKMQESPGRIYKKNGGSDYEKKTALAKGPKTSSESKVEPKKDPFWDMVKRDEEAREKKMQRAPYVCGALWITCFGLFAIYFIMLGTMTSVPVEN